MSQDRLVKLKNKKTGTIIITSRNKKTNPKVKLKKFDPKIRKPAVFEEVKW